MQSGAMPSAGGNLKPTLRLETFSLRFSKPYIGRATNSMELQDLDCSSRPQHTPWERCPGRVASDLHAKQHELPKHCR